MQPEPTFHVRDVPVYGDTILAPMAGYSDIPYRAICRAFGSAMQYTEFVPVEVLVTKKHNSYWDLLKFLPEEQPKVMQIFGNNAQKIVAAARRIEEWEPDIIDINMGCSTRKVSGRGAGVGMMKTPKLIEETFRLLSHHLTVPVTGKIRLGWQENQNYMEIGRILEDNGAALVAIHPRTKEQSYKGKANWDAIAELKQALSIPVIGNGDVSTPAQIDEMLAYTGCDAVMIGRGAIGNPWLLARKEREDLDFATILTAIRKHLNAMVDYHDERIGISMFRKHLKRYLMGIDPVQSLIPQFMQALEMPALNDLLHQAEEMMKPIP